MSAPSAPKKVQQAGESGYQPPKGRPKALPPPGGQAMNGTIIYSLAQQIAEVERILAIQQRIIERERGDIDNPLILAAAERRCAILRAVLCTLQEKGQADV